MVPVLETERLRLRGHRMDDFPASAGMWADPIVTRHFGKSYTEEEVWTRFLRYIGHWSLLGFGYWVVEEKATGSFAGEVGFADYKRNIEPPLGAPEIGWVLASQFHGKGYATEAVRAAVAWGDGYFKSRTTCIIHPANLASIRVAEKCGYREFHRALYHGHPTMMLVRERTIQKDFHPHLGHRSLAPESPAAADIRTIGPDDDTNGSA
jgi:RimJ/RimL family protein N-acetyltransferase